jgi:molybdopterin synthase catalytic subunit
MRPIEAVLTHEVLDPEAMRKSVEHPDLGGVVVFCGEVRSQTGGSPTYGLVYEAYEEMALVQLRRIASEASVRWSAAISVAHRLGSLLPGDIAVVTVAACAHRAEAFECCRWLIDRIKEDVPIWKRELDTPAENTTP